jgi:hypothetical protein
MELMFFCDRVKAALFGSPQASAAAGSSSSWTFSPMGPSGWQPDFNRVQVLVVSPVTGSGASHRIDPDAENKDM